MRSCASGSERWRGRMPGGGGSTSTPWRWIRRAGWWPNSAPSPPTQASGRWRLAAAELDGYRRAYGLDHPGWAKHRWGRVTRDGQATAPVAPLAGEAADRSGQQRERRSRGERIHDQGDRGLLVVAGDRRHQVNSERLLGAEPRRQTPAAAATGRPPKPRSSAWPGGAATAITAAGMPTAFDPAAAWAATKAARNATAVSSRREQQVHQYPDPDPDEEDLEAVGTPVYQGSGLSVRALTA